MAGRRHQPRGRRDGRRLCIVEVWESQAAWDKYFADRLGAVMQEAGRREPEILTFEVHNAYRHGR